MILRTVQPSDVPQVSDIYNHYVRTCTCTFATEPEGPAYWENWLSDHVGPHPAIVAEDDGQILGWASLSRWNSRCAYRHTVEDSVYVRESCRGRGVGRALLGELIGRARLLGHRSVIAQIADHLEGSERLHESCGFRRVGCLESVGYKFNRWIDVVIWQLRLDAAAPPAKPS